MELDLGCRVDVEVRECIFFAINSRAVQKVTLGHLLNGSERCDGSYFIFAIEVSNSYTAENKRTTIIEKL